MANFPSETLPLGKEQLTIVVTGVYDYEIDGDIYDVLNPKSFAVMGADASGNRITRVFTSGVDYTFASNILTFLNDDIFEHQYFVFKITDDDISRETALDGATLDIFRQEVEEEINSILGALNILKEDIIKKRVLTVETSFHSPISLPALATGQSWYYNGTTLEAFDVASVEETVRILDDYVEQVLFPRMDDYVTDTIEPRIDQYVIDTSYVQIDQYIINTAYPTIDNYVETVTKPDIDAFTNVKKNELQALVDNAILDNGTLAPGSDIHQAYYGYWWVDDVTTMINRPPDDLLKGDITGQLSIKESDGQNAGSGSNPPAPRSKCTYIWRGTGGVTLYQIQTDETIFTNWMPLGESASVIPYANTDLVKFPLGLMRAVYWDGANWELAYGNDSAFGIAVRSTTDNVTIYLEGTIILDALDTDADGNPYIDRDYYFLPNNIARAGRLEVDKPEAGIFQSLGRVYTLPSSTIKYFDVVIGTPDDITPIVYTDQGETQIVLRDTFDEYNKFKEYNTLDELGLVAPVVTQDIINAMEDNSVAYIIQSSGDITDVPQSAGTLYVFKSSALRVVVEFTGNHDGVGNRIKYLGSSYDGNWYGFKQIEIQRSVAISVPPAGGQVNIMSEITSHANITGRRCIQIYGLPLGTSSTDVASVYYLDLSSATVAKTLLTIHQGLAGGAGNALRVILSGGQVLLQNDHPTISYTYEVNLI